MNVIENKKDKKISYSFDSVDELTKWLSNTEQTEKGKAYNFSGLISEYRTEFTGTESFEVAQDLLRNGDETLTRMILDTKRDIKASHHKGETKSNMIVRSAQGFIPNIGAYMAGHPLNMLNIKQSFKPVSKVVSIVYDNAVAYDIKTSQMISAAVKVSEVIATLEARGYRINVYIGNKNNGSKSTKVVFLAKIKDAGKPLDPLKISYPLAHPSFFRRHIFAFYERVKWDLPSGYGRVQIMTKEDLKPLVGERYVYLSATKMIENEGQNSVDAIIKKIESTANV